MQTRRILAGTDKQDMRDALMTFWLRFSIVTRPTGSCFGRFCRHLASLLSISSHCELDKLSPRYGLRIASGHHHHFSHYGVRKWRVLSVTGLEVRRLICQSPATVASIGVLSVFVRDVASKLSELFFSCLGWLRRHLQPMAFCDYGILRSSCHAFPRCSLWWCHEFSVCRFSSSSFFLWCAGPFCWQAPVLVFTTTGSFILLRSYVPQCICLCGVSTFHWGRLEAIQHYWTMVILHLRFGIYPWCTNQDGRDP